MTLWGSITHIRSDFVMSNVKMGMWPLQCTLSRGWRNPGGSCTLVGSQSGTFCSPWKGCGFGLTNGTRKTLSIVNVYIYCSLAFQCQNPGTASKLLIAKYLEVRGAANLCGYDLLTFGFGCRWWVSKPTKWLKCENLWILI